MKHKTDTSCRELTLRQTARFLKRHDHYIILTHASPDGDTLGSAYALYYGLNEIGKSACVLCPDVIPKKYDYFARKTDHVLRENATVIAVDVADPCLLGALQEEFGDIVDLTIDHHISNQHYSKYLYLDAGAAATAEAMFELLKIMKVNINDVTAKAL
ncbi:MAG: DHH family phosphoesterase, partial [Clostridia bacterium]|nr:DHH family phosphoesterase [Clostridia bacterium]